jgi:hypothetical protein
MKDFIKVLLVVCLFFLSIGTFIYWVSPSVSWCNTKKKEREILVNKTTGDVIIRQEFTSWKCVEGDIKLDADTLLQLNELNEDK